MGPNRIESVQRFKSWAQTKNNNLTGAGDSDIGQNELEFGPNDVETGPHSLNAGQNGSDSGPTR